MHWNRPSLCLVSVYVFLKEWFNVKEIVVEQSAYRDLNENYHRK